MPEKLPSNPLPENPDVEFEQQEFKKEGFDLKEAIQDEKFFDFLTEYAGENVEALDESEIEKFQEAYKTSNEIKKFYKDVVEKDTGITLESQDLKSLDAYFVTQKDVDPKYIEEVRQFLGEFQSFPKIIAEEEKVLADLGGKEAISQAKARVDTAGLLLERKGILLGQLEKKRELSKDVHGFKGFILLNNWPILGKFFRTEEEDGAYQKTTEEWRKEIANLNIEIEKLADESKKSGKLQEDITKIEEESVALKDKLGALKNFFIEGGFEPAKNILDIAKEKLRQKMRVLADPEKSSVKELERGLEAAKKLSNSELVRLSDDELKKFEKQIDDALERKISSEIIKELQKLSISKVGPLKSVEKLITQYFQKEKIGTKEKKEEIEEVVIKALYEYLKKAKPAEKETNQSFKAKKIAVKCLILQLGYAG